MSRASQVDESLDAFAHRRARQYIVGRNVFPEGHPQHESRVNGMAQKFKEYLWESFLRDQRKRHLIP